MIVIGVTGSLASGKSATVKILKKLGSKVFDADFSARQIVRKGTPTYQAIVKLFGKEFLGPNKELDRAKLAHHVFSNPKDLKKLNILIHPQVIFDCLGFIEKYRQSDAILVLDVPLLFESRMGNLADYTIVIASSQKKTLDRAKNKGVNEDLARKILSTQWPVEKKKKMADFFIENNGTLKDLENKIKQVLKTIKQKGA